MARASVACAAAAQPFTAQAADSQQPPAPPGPGEVVFFTHTLCPYAERVWIALLEKGVPFRLVHIDLSSKPGWYRRINSRGLVPAVLLHGGQVHLESADICRWLDGAFSGPQLVPADPGLRSEMDGLLRGACSGAVSAGLDLMAGRGRYWGIGSGQTAAQRAEMDAALQPLAAVLERHGGPFLLGGTPSLADINVYPFLKRFAVARELTGYDLRAAHGGAIGRWLAAMDARPSCTATAAEEGLLLQAFRRHRSLDFFDYDSYGPFDLHPANAHLLTS